MTAFDEKRNKNLIIIALALCSFWVGLDLLIVSPLIPIMSSSLDFSIDKGGLLITFYALFYGITAPIFGPFSDRWGRKKMITLGLVIFSVGTFLTALGDSLWITLVFRALSGLGAALIMPNVYALVGDYFDYSQRGKIMGLITGAMGGASVLGIPVGSFLANGSSWQMPFIIISVFSTVTLLLILRVLPRPQVKGSNVRPSFTKNIQMAFSNRSILFALFCTFLFWAGFQGMFANMGNFYYKNYLLETNLLGLIFSLTGLGNIIGNVVGGRISDKIGKKRSILICCGLSSVCVVFIPMIHSYFWFVITTHFLWSMSTGFGQASLTSFMSELNPQIRGTVLSLNSSATYLGMTFTTLISTFVLESQGFLLLGIICSLCFLVIVPIISNLVSEKMPSVETKAG
ncbi:MFS transporter [Ammoniphilus sp. CFH 90114]|uniref:MFS transporter n=1 Tax=Ammoniphilus sp. CFH 90114 TaxID=2493665 RepID=UPI0013E9370F|nr:MFS transporter [Ammoniphilus sp. CFH 90114]